MNEGKIIVYVIAAGLFIILLFFFNRTGVKKEESKEFNGVIQEVTYGDKHTPIVTINGAIFAVGFPNENFKNRIEKGDSLTKMKNSKVYKLVKRGTGEVIFSK
jgi:preprotein translocase subunit YajC